MEFQENTTFTREEYEELIELLWTGNSVALAALHDPDLERGHALARSHLLEYDRICRLSDLGKAFLHRSKPTKEDEKIL